MRKSVKNRELYGCPRSGQFVRGADRAVSPFRQRHGGEVRRALRAKMESAGRGRMEERHRGGIPAAVPGPGGPRWRSVL